MRKRILLVEESDAIRNIAESLLRQDGYELISIPSGDKALEVMEFTKPDLIIAASDVHARGQKKLYEILSEEHKYKEIPTLILSHQEEAGLPYPEELILPKPFDSSEFKGKVESLLHVEGQSQQPQPPTPSPVASEVISDDFLDAALGLDQIEVTDSEDITSSHSTKKRKKRNVDDTLIGMESVNEKDSDSPSDSGKVESLMILEENSDIKPVTDGPPKKEITKSGTGRLDILEDQFGLIEKTDFHDADADHDYHWFLNELQKESIDKTKNSDSNSNSQSDSQELSFEDNASLVDPFTPVNSKEKSTSGKTSNQDVDKFIDEFKKEVKKLDKSGPDSMTISESVDMSARGDEKNWDDSVEKITPEGFAFFTNQLVKELAEKIAVQVVNKIDSEKLMALIKTEIMKHLKDK